MALIYIFFNVLVIFHITCSQSDRTVHSQLASNAYSNNDVHCRIPMSELLSTVNRVMQGICNPRQLNERFVALETQIVEQFNVLKTMVLSIEDKLLDQDERIRLQHRKLHRSLITFRNIRRIISKNGNRTYLKPKEVGSTGFAKTEENAFEFHSRSNKNAVDDFDTAAISGPSPRQQEIDQQNSTIRYENGKRIFTYYWTVRDIFYRMKNWGWQRYLKSNDFYITDYRYKMYIKIVPNKDGKNVYLHVGLTKGEFDASLEWPFRLKHKIQVINHDERGMDLVSRIWDPTKICSEWNWMKPVRRVAENYECVGLGFSQQMLYSSEFVCNNAITIQLSVFLN